MESLGLWKAARYFQGQQQEVTGDVPRWQHNWLIGVRDILQGVSEYWPGGQSSGGVWPRSRISILIVDWKKRAKDRVLDQLKFWHYKLANLNFIPILFSFAHLHREKLNIHFLRLPCNCKGWGHVTQFWSVRCKESFMGASGETSDFLIQGAERTGASPLFSHILSWMWMHCLELWQPFCNHEGKISQVIKPMDLTSLHYWITVTRIVIISKYVIMWEKKTFTGLSNWSSSWLVGTCYLQPKALI